MSTKKKNPNDTLAECPYINRKNAQAAAASFREIERQRIKKGWRWYKVADDLWLFLARKEARKRKLI